MGPDWRFINTARDLARERTGVARQDAESRRIAAEANAVLDRTRASVLPGLTEAQITGQIADANRSQAVANTTYDLNPFQQALLGGQAFNQGTQGQVNQQQAFGIFRNNQDAPSWLLGGVGGRMGLAGGLPGVINMPRAEPVALSPSMAPAPMGMPTPLSQPQMMPGGGVGFGGPTITATGVTRSAPTRMGLPPASSWDTLGPAGRARIQDEDARRQSSGALAYAKGTARVPGKGDGTKDTVDAKLAPNEAVLNREAADMLGRGLIEALNAVGAQKMGMV